MSILQPDLLAALHQIPGLSTKSLTKLLASDLLTQPPDSWTQPQLISTGIEPARAKTILAGIPKIDIAAARARLEKNEIHVITMVDPEYAPLLKEIPAPPPILYVRGNTTALQTILLAVVGTRQPTPYGQQATKLLVEPIARSGIGIVSGLALGIDGIAHAIALRERVPTVAVLGCSVDTIYPWQHKQLAEQIIAAGGAVISEFPLGAQPERHHFPQRNRIISGLARGVLLVEAGEKSGALITAKYAVDQNREVFAVPGQITSPQSMGPIHWIQLGAKAVHTAKDILEFYAVTAPPEKAPNATHSPNDPTQQAILEKMTHEPQHVDVLAASCRLEASVVSAALVLLELDGRVAHHGGMYYSLTS